MYLSDSNGKKSLTATFSIVAFIITMIKILLNNSAIQVAGFAYSFGSIDATTVAAVLSPILGTYAFRRYTDMRYGTQHGPWDDSYDQSYTQVQEEIGSDMGSRPGDGGR